MKRLLVLLGACAPPPAAVPLSSHVAPAPPPAQRVLVQRAVSVDGLAMRATWTIAIDGDRATLAVVRETTTDPVLLGSLDAATWVRAEADAPLERAAVVRVGDRVALDFASLQLRCWEREITAAPAGAVLHHGASCDDPVWNRKDRVRVAIWACGFGELLDDGQRAGLDGTTGDLDETLFRFAPAPGIELVEADCVKGLRLAR